MSFQELLIHTVDLKKPVENTVDGTPQTLGYTVESSSVKARLVPRSPKLQSSLMGRYTQATHLAFFDRDVSIKPYYIVVDLANSKEYFVLEVEKALGMYVIHHYEVALEERLVT